MRPRSAVAAYILSVVTAALNDKAALHKFAETYKVKRPPLKAKEKTRIGMIAEFYLNTVTQTLGTTPFEGDVAEVGPGAAYHKTRAPVEKDEPIPADDTTASADTADTADTFAGIASGDTASNGSNGEQLGFIVGQLLGGAPPSGVSITINVTGDVNIGDVGDGKTSN